MKSRVCSGNGLIQIGVAAIVNNPRVSATRILMFPVQTTIHHNDFFFIFHPVCLKCYLVRPQTNVHPGFKRGKETRLVIWSEPTMSFHSEPHSAECCYRHGLWWQDLHSDANSDP